MIDFILDALESDSPLLMFISRNLSWGVFQAALDDKVPDEDLVFYDAYLGLLEKDEHTFGDRAGKLHLLQLYSLSAAGFTQ